jgi:hypothetical protein
VIILSKLVKTCLCGSQHFYIINDGVFECRVCEEKYVSSQLNESKLTRFYELITSLINEACVFIRGCPWFYNINSLCDKTFKETQKCKRSK